MSFTGPSRAGAHCEGGWWKQDGRVKGVCLLVPPAALSFRELWWCPCQRLCLKVNFPPVTAVEVVLIYLEVTLFILYMSLSMSQAPNHTFNLIQYQVYSNILFAVLEFLAECWLYLLYLFYWIEEYRYQSMGLATHEFGWKHGNKPEDINKMPSSTVEVICSKIALKNNVIWNLPNNCTHWSCLCISVWSDNNLVSTPSAAGGTSEWLERQTVGWWKEYSNVRNRAESATRCREDTQ